jgi:hypothetical protein
MDQDATRLGIGDGGDRCGAPLGLVLQERQEVQRCGVQAVIPAVLPELGVRDVVQREVDGAERGPSRRGSGGMSS